MVAVGIMVVHTDAGGQRQRFKNTPLVLQEQGILACRRTAAGAARQVDRILQLIVTPFAAEGHQLVDVAQRQHVFPVYRVALGGDRIAVARVFVIHLLAVNLQLAVADAPAAVVAERVVLPLKAVFVEGIRVTILTIETVARRKVMIFRRRPGEFHIRIAAGEALNARCFTARRGRRFLLTVFLALREATVGFQPQQAVHQRTAGIELTVVGVSTVAVFLNRGVGAQGARPFLADFFGDNVHHAAQGIGTVQRRHRSAHHFDSFDGVNRHPVEVEIIMAEHRVTRVDALAVDQDQRVAAVQSTDTYPFTVVPFARELNARHLP